MKTSDTSGRIYFPGLNGLRFFAALGVLLGHVEQFKVLFGISETWYNHLPILQIFMDGRDSVTFFFVISGFLITYLLLVELDQTETISLRKFYMRRILRIWPLYYLLVFIGFFAIPLIVHVIDFQGYYVSIGKYFVPLFAVYMLFLAHMSVLPNPVFGPVGITHLWSIAIEEQFYLIWPLLLKRFRNRLFLCLVGVIVFRVAAYLLYDVYIGLRGYAGPPFSALDNILSYVWALRVESMAIGGLGAYLLFNYRDRFLKLVFHPLVEKGVLLVFFVNVVFFRSDTWMGDFFVSFVYIIVILNVVLNPRSTIKLEIPILRHLGGLSYGIYMYHIPVIYLLLMGFYSLNLATDTLAFDLVLYPLVLLLTYGIAYLSYNYFEVPFLQLKKRFAVVPSNVDYPSRRIWISGLANGLIRRIKRRDR